MFGLCSSIFILAVDKIAVWTELTFAILEATCVAEQNMLLKNHRVPTFTPLRCVGAATVFTVTT